MQFLRSILDLHQYLLLRVFFRFIPTQKQHRLVRLPLVEFLKFTRLQDLAL